MASRDFSSEAVRVFKALSDRTRYSIVVMLLQKGELGCADFAENFPLSIPAMSHHYRVLENAGLVFTRKEGSHVFLRLNVDQLHRFVPGFEAAHALSGAEKSHKEVGKQQ